MSLITLITPCYNGEKHLENYINGLLSQTANNVEYFFVNDGSTDKTKDIILSYKKALKDKGWTFNYIEQENSGQASAINKALKIMTGDYFSCIDSDDILMPEYLEKMSKYLELNSNIDMVFPIAEMVKQNSLEHLCFLRREVENNTIDTFFEDMLLSNENLPAFATFMQKTESFCKYNSSKQIYEGFSGQNPQLILPIAYNGKIAYLNDCLIKIVYRENSDCHSAMQRKIINWDNLYSETLKYIPNMPEYEKAYYFQKIKERWSSSRIKIRKNEKSKRISINMLGIKIKMKVPKIF